jgi:hypothetical protein
MSQGKKRYIRMHVGNRAESGSVLPLMKGSGGREEMEIGLRSG